MIGQHTVPEHDHGSLPALALNFLDGPQHAGVGDKARIPGEFQGTGQQVGHSDIMSPIFQPLQSHFSFGHKSLHLGGISQEHTPGITAFKLGLNGERYELVGEYWKW